MGCNCKQQVKQEKIVPKGITPIQVVAVQPEEVTYTIEEIIRIKDYMSSTNKTEIEKQFVSDFMLINFGDIIPSYCDQICLSRINKRVEQALLRLNKK